MWRLANCVYRAFRNSATYYCSQDILVPFSTICSTDDSQLHLYENNYSIYGIQLHFVLFLFSREKHSISKKCDIQNILKNYEFTFRNIEKLQDFLKSLSIQLVRY